MSDPVVYLVNDHDCGQCGRILGVFSTREKAGELVTRYRDAYDADVWPDDLPYTGSVSQIDIEEWVVDDPDRDPATLNGNGAKP